ncbi:MAG: response regulator, partial [Oligoflexia bacterium]|nr:response regulator [Oligoflexia bacterium]
LAIQLAGIINNGPPISIDVISNAKDAVLEKEGGLIEISNSIHDGKLIITVADNGCGIKEEEILKIFDAFYTTKPIGKGTGLGLGITRSLTEDMGGVITVKSKFGEGSVFSVSFPINIENHHHPDDMHVSSKKNIEEFKIIGRALVVDDEKEILRIMLNYLQHIGLTVDTASNGEEGLSLIRKGGYDYMFLDIKMPKIDGINLLRMAKEQCLIKNGRVILMTGNSQNESDEKLFQNMMELADEIIQKPFTKDILYQIIKELSQVKPPPPPPPLPPLD